MTVELAQRIGELVAERQRLRAEGAPRAELERNRLAIGRLQRRLAYAALAERAGQAPHRIPVARHVI